MEENNQDTVYIYTDGSCFPNPGPGGWGVLSIFRGKASYQWGGAEEQTNNSMEYKAILQGLKNKPADAKKCIVYSDSQYCINSITTWCEKWAKNGWVTSSGKPIKNLDVLQDVLSVKGDSQFVWVRGHNGNLFNEAAHNLANIGRLHAKHGSEYSYENDLNKVKELVEKNYISMDDCGTPSSFIKAATDIDYTDLPNSRDLLAAMLWDGGDNNIKYAYEKADLFITNARRCGEYKNNIK